MMKFLISEGNPLAQAEGRAEGMAGRGKDRCGPSLDHRREELTGSVELALGGVGRDVGTCLDFV
jgi:hypothetical protein